MQILGEQPYNMSALVRHIFLVLHITMALHWWYYVVS